MNPSTYGVPVALEVAAAVELVAPPLALVDDFEPLELLELLPQPARTNKSKTKDAAAPVRRGLCNAEPTTPPSPVARSMPPLIKDAVWAGVAGRL
jgi:hypothetical protein